MQAIFVFPLYAVLLLRGKLPAWSALLLPLVYFVLCVPSWAAGRHLGDLLSIYLAQAHTYEELTKSAPNFYQWLPNEQFAVFRSFGLALSITVACFLVAWGVRHSPRWSREQTLAFALLCALLFPYCLPQMHDRYFYLADVLSLAYVASYPRSWPVALLTIGTSAFCYCPFLFDTTPMRLDLLAFLPPVAIVLVGRRLVVSDLALRDSATHGDRRVFVPAPSSRVAP